MPKKSQLGFTLIEALVVVLIIGVLGFMLSDLLTRTFRGSNKTQLIGSIKQNGQLALNTLDYTIRNSERVICPPSNTSSVTTDSTQPGATIALIATVKNGKYSVFWFNPPKLTSTLENGYIARLDTNTDPITNGSCLPPTDTTSSLYPERNNKVYLTDINPNSGVSLKPGSFFYRSSLPGAKDKIEVSFELGPGENLKGSFDNQIGQGGVIFNTSIEIR